MSRPKPLVLCVLDGFGERAEKDANAILLAKAPNLAGIRERYPRTLVDASGTAVGLPKGQMGNSEVGHLNLGAGRVAQMDLSRIDVAVAEHTLGRNEVLSSVIHGALDTKVQPPILSSISLGMPDMLTEEPSPGEHHDHPPPARVHLMGLLSDGGVHSSIEHLFEIIDVVSANEVPVVVHAFLDGRDTPPRSALGYLQRLEAHLEGRGVIGTVGGRYWGMDRDKHWGRVKKAFDAIVAGEVANEPDALAYVEACYAKDVTDEFVEPVRIGDYAGLRGGARGEFENGKPPEWSWFGDEFGICFNFRPDRMRELCAMLLHKNLPPEVAAELKYNHMPIRAFSRSTLVSLTEYDPKLDMRVAFPKEPIDESFGEIVAKAGLKQFRCAETEKYAHVTYFFNGGREAAFEGEERKLVPSPRDVATYDLKPAMSAEGVTRAVVEAIESDAYDFILVNFANPDMVGHTGVLDAATRAVEEVDVGIGKIRDAVLKKGGALIISADHGNCETMIDAEGRPHTAHTTNPVPLYYVSATDTDVSFKDGGRLADIAPTMLEILGLPQPAKMTGHSLRIGRGR